MPLEKIFAMDTSSIKYGSGATREVGHDMKDFGGHRVMVLVDPGLGESETLSIVLEALQVEGIETEVYNQITIEPTDVSFKAAIRFASTGKFDGYVAVGGGSTIDTMKAANLYATHPADFLTYVNAPIGAGRPVPGALKPMIAIPTTTGTGSETSGIAIFDFLDMRVKTGIAHRVLRPMMGIIDPENTRTLPHIFAACCSLDVLSHAIESLTALPYTKRQSPITPRFRPAYQGANPISDIWAARAIEICSHYLTRMLDDLSDDEARSQMMLAATFAGIGFGNAGVTLPHGMSYAVAGMVRDYQCQDYPTDRPLIPHGMSVILTAPAAFRFTAQANPERHLYAASLMGVDIANAAPKDAGDLLANAVIKQMKKAGMPNGLSEVGYDMDDIENLVEGTIPQHRVTRLSPIPARSEDLHRLFVESLKIW